MRILISSLSTRFLSVSIFVHLIAVLAYPEWIACMSNVSPLANDIINYSFFFSIFLDRGIPYISKDRHLRIEAIGNFLAENSQYDVVSLQEVWTEYDYQKIKKLAENVLPYAHYFYRWVMAQSRQRSVHLEFIPPFPFQRCLWVGVVRSVEIPDCDHAVSRMVGERIRSSHSTRRLVRW